MGRESGWTPEEDAILLRTRGWPAAEVNQELERAGFKPRPLDEGGAEKIKQRRDYITHRPNLLSAALAASHGREITDRLDMQESMEATLVRMNTLATRLQRYEAECAQLPMIRQQLAEATEVFQRLLRSHKEEAAG